MSLAQTRPSSSDSDVVPTEARIQRVPWPIVPLERCLRWAFAQLLTGDAFPVGKSRSWDILLQPCDGGLDAFVRSRAGLELVGTLAPGDTQATTLKAKLRQRSGTGHQVVLRLSPDQVLQRPIEVPMAAEDVLAQVLTHQMERWTPWPATQSLMGYKILARDTEAGVIRAQVVFTSKVLVEQTRARLQALGLAPARIEFAAADDDVYLIDAAPDRRALRYAPVCAWATAGLLVAALGSAATAVPGLIGHVRALHAIKDEVSGLRQRLEAERGARTAADTFGVTWEQLARQKLDRPSSSVLLEAISRLLPDDAWLTELRVDNDIVRMTGHSRNSGRLIAAIEATPQLRNAEFAGPTSLRTSDQLETFVITARAVPRLQQRN